MHKVFAVIRREFLERVRTKQFLIGTLLGPLLLGGMIVLPVLLARNTSVKHLVVLDAASGEFGSRVEQTLALATRGDKPDGEKRYQVERVTLDGRSVDAVRDSLVAITDADSLGEAAIHGFLVLTDDVLTRDTLFYYGANAGSPSDMEALRGVLRRAVLLERLGRAGIPPATMMGAIKPVTVRTERVSGGAVTGQSGAVSFVIAYVMTLVLYMALLIYGTQVLTSTVEEKTNRINEILVSSLRPDELMLGKVIGVGSVGLVQLGIYAAAGWFLTSQRQVIGRMLGANPDAISQLPIPSLPIDLLLVFLLFFLLGFFFYAAAYAAVGSTCSTVQETQQASLPVTLVVVVGLFLMFSLLDDPDGTMGRILSLVPPFAPFVTPVRYSLSPLRPVELMLSIGSMVAGVFAMAWVAGRIYRVGILMYGKRASLREVLRWIRS